MLRRQSSPKVNPTGRLADQRTSAPPPTIADGVPMRSTRDVPGAVTPPQRRWNHQRQDLLRLISSQNIYTIQSSHDVLGLEQPAYVVELDDVGKHDQRSLENCVA